MLYQGPITEQAENSKYMKRNMFVRLTVIINAYVTTLNCFIILTAVPSQDM